MLWLIWPAGNADLLTGATALLGHASDPLGPTLAEHKPSIKINCFSVTLLAVLPTSKDWFQKLST